MRRGKRTLLFIIGFSGLLSSACNNDDALVVNSETVLGVWVGGSNNRYDGEYNSMACHLRDRNVVLSLFSNGSMSFVGESYESGTGDCECSVGELYTASYDLVGTWGLQGDRLETLSSGTFDQCGTTQDLDTGYNGTATFESENVLVLTAGLVNRPDYRLTRSN